MRRFVALFHYTATVRCFNKMDWIVESFLFDIALFGPLLILISIGQFFVGIEGVVLGMVSWLIIILGLFG